MEVRIIHHTVGDLDSRENGILVSRDKHREYEPKEMQIIGGQAAGFCYLSEDYMEDGIYNNESSMRRANNTVKSGHHSLFDHGSIGIELKYIPKILAMILNSTEYYTTSEQSGRRTKMNPDTQLELDIYNKWVKILEKKVMDLGIPGITEKDANKLALENARGMTSVFTLISMEFTTTYRQFNYLGQWLRGLVSDLNERPNKFNLRLAKYCEELATHVEEIAKGFVVDNKGGYIQFLPRQHGLPAIQDACKIGNTYEITYYSSFSSLAQLQRHRTIHYEMDFSGDIPGEYGCYTPIIIRGDKELEQEWENDFKALADQFPQCTLVKVREEGRAYWFLKKCAERLCGRAQLETAMNVKANTALFLANLDKLDEHLQKEFLEYTDKDGNIIPRCGTSWFKCTEVCQFGVKHGLDRVI